MTAVGNQLGHTLRDGGVVNIMLLIVLALFTAAAGWVIQRRLAMQDGRTVRERKEAPAERAAAGG
jgi:hypothetical protein